jgi:hypothetical protein
MRQSECNTISHEYDIVDLQLCAKGELQNVMDSTWSGSSFWSITSFLYV